MKLLYCTRCGDIRGLLERWTRCECGLCAARWVDPNTGKAEVLTADRDFPRIIGLNNRFLLGASKAPAEKTWEGKFHQELHASAVEAPGYIFDKNNRNCWACVFRVGETGDVSWNRNQTKVWEGEMLYQEALSAR